MFRVQEGAKAIQAVIPKTKRTLEALLENWRESKETMIIPGLRCKQAKLNRFKVLFVASYKVGMVLGPQGRLLLTMLSHSWQIHSSIISEAISYHQRLAKSSSHPYKSTPSTMVL